MQEAVKVLQRKRLARLKRSAKGVQHIFSDLDSNTYANTLGTGALNVSEGQATTPVAWHRMDRPHVPKKNTLQVDPVYRSHNLVIQSREVRGRYT